MLWRHVQLTGSPLPPPPIAFSMHKQAYVPERNHLLQLSPCPDQCLVRANVHPVEKLWQWLQEAVLCHPCHLRQVRRVRALRPRCDESSTRLKRRTWANTLLFTHMSCDLLSSTHWPYTVCHALLYGRCSLRDRIGQNCICLVTICVYMRP